MLSCVTWNYDLGFYVFWLLFSYSPARCYRLLHKNCPRQQFRALVCVEIRISGLLNDQPSHCNTKHYNLKLALWSSVSSIAFLLSISLGAWSILGWTKVSWVKCINFWQDDQSTWNTSSATWNRAKTADSRGLKIFQSVKILGSKIGNHSNKKSNIILRHCIIVSGIKMPLLLTS